MPVRVCTWGTGSIPRHGAQTPGNCCLPVPALPRLQWETQSRSLKSLQFYCFHDNPDTWRGARILLQPSEARGRGRRNPGFVYNECGRDGSARVRRQQHPYAPTPRETLTRVCTHILHVHAHTPYTHTGRGTHAHTCTPAVQVPTQGQAWSGVTGRLTRGQALCRPLTAVNQTTAETTTEGTTAAVRAPQPGEEQGEPCSQGANGVHVRVHAQGCVCKAVFFCARVQGCVLGAVRGAVRAGVLVQHRVRARCLPWGSRLALPLAPCGASPGLQSGSLISLSRRGVPGGRCAGMGTPRGQGWRCCRDGDTTGMGTSRTPLCWRGRGQAEPQGLLAERGSGRHQGVWEAPARPSLSYHPWASPGRAPRGALHLAAPGQVPSALRSPQVLGATARLPPARRTPGGAAVASPRLPHRPPPGDRAAPPGTVCPRRPAGPTAAFWVDFAAFGARSRQWRPGSPREGGA